MLLVAGQHESPRIIGSVADPVILHLQWSCQYLLQIGLDNSQVLRQLLLGGRQPQPFLVPLELRAAHLLLDCLHLLLQPADQGKLALHSTSQLSARHHNPDKCLHLLLQPAGHGQLALHNTS